MALTNTGFGEYFKMWVEFVVGSRLAPRVFVSGFSGFPPSTETNASKFQFDLDVTVSIDNIPRE